MNKTMFGIASGLALAAGASAVDWNLAGKVVDAASTSGLAGVEVRLAVAGTKVTTGTDGSWVIGTASVRSRRIAPSGKVVNSLKVIDGHLRLTIDGSDLFGRRLPTTWGAPPSASEVRAPSLAARAQAAVVDTLVYFKSTHIVKRVPLTNSVGQGLLVQLSKPIATPLTNFTDTVKGVALDMVQVPGGTFTIGCETGTCPADAKPVADVKVSSYHIGKTEVTAGLWKAVMGTSAGFGGATASYTSMTWYDAQEFACRLSELTGRQYRMTTEAEWEYAAKNSKSSLEKIGTGEEWAYNSWNSAHTGGTDPVGVNSGLHTQKTRRDAQGTADNITGRLIRSIEGIGPALRLVVSDGMDFPPGMVPMCQLHAPNSGSEPENSYRDPRWITGSGRHWKTGSIAIGNFDLRVWDDGTAKLGNTSGQWFTSNNIAFVFVPNTGAITKFAYILLDTTQASLISDKGFMNGGYIGRIVKDTGANVTKPTIATLKTGAELAAAAGADFAMVNMANIPETAKKQDARLLDGLTSGWFQDNRSAGGVHHYRKDVDADEFRFTVNQGTSRTILTNGKWFTVNNTFLRVTHSGGYTTDYLYAVDADGTFYHNSYQAYERGDFRMFKKTANGSEPFTATCGSICTDEIPKGEKASLYATMENGKSTFTPAPCPTGGCP
ncbi:MAG: SUMF1/EgtB/PvdO family nonheme iron enzyme [Fibrobacterota bacterium]|nr:MAG: SUMF1/EgtB/PvdO family nonheme iron enzyme [Fibrobacterota bacterium]